MTSVVIYYFPGTNAEEARRIIKSSGLSVETAGDLTEAASKAVASLKL